MSYLRKFVFAYREPHSFLNRTDDRPRANHRAIHVEERTNAAGRGNHRISSRSQHAPHFPQRLFVTGQIFHDTETYDAVEAVLGKRNALDVADLEALRIIVLLRILHHSFRNIGAPGLVSATSELRCQMPGSTAHIQNLRSLWEACFDHFDRKSPARN